MHLRTLFLAAGLAALTGCETHHTATTYWNPVSKIRKAEGPAYFKTSEDGRETEVRDGLWTTWHRNTQKHTECFYKDGVPVGEVKVWYPDGKLKYRANFDEKGLLDGEVVFYSPSGETKTGIMTHGTGTVYSFRDDGSLKSAIGYFRGILHGPALFYDENGRLFRTEHYVRGEKTDPK